MKTDYTRDGSSSALLNTNKDKLKEYRKSKAIYSRLARLEYEVANLTDKLNIVLTEIEAKK